MRYALTIQPGDTFASVDTFIIEDDRAEEEAGRSWKDGGEELHKILAHLVGKSAADAVIKNKLYFIRCCDDIDFNLEDTIVVNGAEKNFNETQLEDF